MPPCIYKFHSHLHGLTRNLLGAVALRGSHPPPTSTSPSTRLSLPQRSRNHEPPLLDRALPGLNPGHNPRDPRPHNNIPLHRAGAPTRPLNAQPRERALRAGAPDPPAHARRLRHGAVPGLVQLGRGAGAAKGPRGVRGGVRGDDLLHRRVQVEGAADDGVRGSGGTGQGCARGGGGMRRVPKILVRHAGRRRAKPRDVRLALQDRRDEGGPHAGAPQGGAGDGGHVRRVED